MKHNPKRRLYSLYIENQRVSTHAYPLEAAGVVFGMRAAWASKHGKKTELRAVKRKG